MVKTLYRRHALRPERVEKGTSRDRDNAGWAPNLVAGPCRTNLCRASVSLDSTPQTLVNPGIGLDIHADRPIIRLKRMMDGAQ